MARPTEKSRVDKWKARVRAANKVYKDWDDEFDTSNLEDYYKGFQWRGQNVEAEADKYVINLIFSSIETRKPSLLFFRPVARVSPRDAKADDPGSFVDERAQLREDIANTFLGDKRLHFREHTALALHESMFRFGVIETGYSGDWIDNPNAGKPVINEKTGDPMVDKEGAPLAQPARILREGSKESLYFRRIPAKDFRISPSNRNILEENDWYGYGEWVQIEDVKKNPAYKNTSGLKPGGQPRKDMDDRTEEEKGDPDKAGLIKVWKIWSFRDKARFVFPETGEKFFVEGEPFDTRQHSVLKHYELLDSFYPLPPVFNWLHPQREQNDIREARRAHRKRFYRRFGRSAACNTEELDKLASGGDGVVVELPSKDAFWAIEDAPLDHSTERDAAQSREDFREVSGVSGEQNQIPESETATQAQIIELRSNIRENFQRFLVAEWLGDIVTVLLKTVEKRMMLPMLIKTVVDPQALGAAQELAEVVATWRNIQIADLGDFEYDATVDIESLSPATQDAKRQQWFTTWDLIFRNQALMIGIALSDTIAKKTFALLEVRSDKEVSEIRKLVAVLAMATMSAQPAGAGAPSPPPQPGAGPTPSLPEIGGQLGAQMGTAA